MATFKEYKKKGKNYWMFKTYLGIDVVTGKQIHTTRRGFTTKKEAQYELSKLIVDFETGGLSKKKKLKTYQEVYDDWIIQYKNTVKESTFVKTKRIFKNHVLPFFSTMRIEKIEIKHCQDAVNLWASKLSRFSMVMNYAGMVFDYAVRNGYIPVNPCKAITKPISKIEKERKLNFYTKDELTLFFECLKKESLPQIFMLFRLLAYSGMRKGEALALTWDDVNFTEKTISINKALTRGEGSKLIIQDPKTIDSKRIIELDSDTINYLKKWNIMQKKNSLLLGIRLQKNKQLIFSNSKNELLQPTITRKYMQKICKKYKLKEITTHGFRHTHCSILFEAGASIKEVQDRLGHTDIKTTMNVYAHVSPRRRIETADLFAKYMKK